MESPPAAPDPYKILKTGQWPLTEVNPRAVTRDLIESGAISPNYPAPSFGPAPLLPPVPSAPPLNGDEFDGEQWIFDPRLALKWAPLGVAVVALASGILLAIRTTE